MPCAYKRVHLAVLGCRQHLFAMGEAVSSGEESDVEELDELDEDKIKAMVILPLAAACHVYTLVS